MTSEQRYSPTGRADHALDGSARDAPAATGWHPAHRPDQAARRSSRAERHVMDPNGPVVVMVANPGGPGRTGAAARAVAGRVATLGPGAADGRLAPIAEIDLAEEPERLLGWGSELAGRHRAAINAARALVVA